MAAELENVHTVGRDTKLPFLNRSIKAFFCIGDYNVVLILCMFILVIYHHIRKILIYLILVASYCMYMLAS